MPRKQEWSVRPATLAPKTPAINDSLKLNQVYLRGELGRLLINACLAHVSTKPFEIAIFTDLSLKKVNAMQLGDVSQYTLEDIKQACCALYWVLVYSVDKHQFNARIKLPSKVYRLSGCWNDDQHEIDTILAARKAKQSKQKTA